MLAAMPKTMNRLTLVVIVLLAGQGRSGAQTADQSVKQLGPSCSEVYNSPEKYIGKAVVFWGSLVRFEMKPINGKQDMVNTFSCKDRAGNAVGGIFAYLGSESKWTDAAGKANTMKELFRISGVVGRVEGSIPFLRNVLLELDSEVK